MPTAMIAAVMTSSGAAARLSMNGSFGVRIMCTTSVCVSRPTTNQPDWNRLCRAIVFASNTNHIRAKVAMSKTELIGPKKTMKRPMSPGFHLSGLLTSSGSTLSNGMPVCAMS